MTEFNYVPRGTFSALSLGVSNTAQKMAAIVSNEKTEAILRKILALQGYTLSKPKAYGQTGTDILADKNGKKYHIEVIGYKDSGPARAKDFFEAFFRAISRIKDGASFCVIALPIESKQGLPARATEYGVAWERIGVAFPELEIWLVDTSKETIKHTKWNDWSF